MVVFRHCCGPGTCEDKWLPDDWEDSSPLLNTKYSHGIYGQLSYNAPFFTWKEDISVPGTSVTPIDSSERGRLITNLDGIRKYAWTEPLTVNVDWEYDSGPYQWPKEPFFPSTGFGGYTEGLFDIKAWKRLISIPRYDEDGLYRSCEHLVGRQLNQSLYYYNGEEDIVINTGGSIPDAERTLRLDNVSCIGKANYDTSTVLTWPHPTRTDGAEYQLRVYTNSAAGIGPHGLTAQTANWCHPTPGGGTEGSIASGYSQYINTGMTVINGTITSPWWGGFPRLYIGSTALYPDLRNGQPEILGDGEIRTKLDVEFTGRIDSQEALLKARVHNPYQSFTIQYPEWYYKLNADRCQIVSGVGGTVSDPLTGAISQSHRLYSIPFITHPFGFTEDFVIAQAPLVNSYTKFTQPGSADRRPVWLSELLDEFGAPLSVGQPYLFCVDFSYVIDGNSGHPFYLWWVDRIADEDNDLLTMTYDPETSPNFWPPTDYANWRGRRTHWNTTMPLIAEIDCVYELEENDEPLRGNMTGRYKNNSYIFETEDPLKNWNEWTGEIDRDMLKDPEDFEVHLTQEMDVGWSSDITGNITYARIDNEPEE